MAQETELPKCRDGYDRNHGFVIAKGRYGCWSKFGLFTGLSVSPYKVVYQCSICNEEFDETTDPEILKNFY